MTRDIQFLRGPPTTKLRTICLFLLVLGAAAQLSWAQNIVSDDEHRFTVAVPIGWRVIKQPDHMKLTMGDSTIHILYVPGQSNAAHVGEAALAASGESYVNVVDTDHGETQLGGDHGVFVNFQGYDERSVSMLVHITATDSGWVFFAATPEAAYSSLREQFKKIEHSFVLTKNIPRADPSPEPAQPPAPQKTDPAPHS